MSHTSVRTGSLSTCAAAILAIGIGVASAGAGQQTAAAAGNPPPTEQDRAAVRQAAYDYAEGFYEGAADRMARGVHPMIVKRGVMSPPGGPSILQPMNSETLVEMTRQGVGTSRGPDQRNISFELLDIRDNVASAKIFTAGFNDYLHLVKQDGRWRIANVLWQPPLPTGVANGAADRTAALQAVRTFVDATAASDAARLDGVVHPEAALRVFRSASPTGPYIIVEGNRDAFEAQVRMKRMPPLRAPTVTVLDAYDTMASALVTTESGMMGYFHLAKQNDQWRIVNLLLR